MVDSTSPEAQSPDRFIKMGAALNETDRDIKLFLCQWGIGENVPDWYVAIVCSLVAMFTHTY
jgi:alpha-galactosidase